MALNFKGLRPQKQEYGEGIRRRLATLPDAKVTDLQQRESKRTRIRRSAYCLNDSACRSHGASTCLLIAEPDNTLDSKAIAVYSTKGLRVGYLSATASARFSPLFIQLGADAFKASGAGTTSSSDAAARIVIATGHDNPSHLPIAVALNCYSGDDL